MASPVGASGSWDCKGKPGWKPSQGAGRNWGKGTHPGRGLADTGGHLLWCWKRAKKASKKGQGLTPGGGERINLNQGAALFDRHPPHYWTGVYKDVTGFSTQRQPSPFPR